MQTNSNGSGHPPELQLATFFLGDYCFGIDLLEIQEINRQRDLTEVPHTAEHVRGVINLRGEVVTVLDLRTMLGLAPLEFTRLTRNIILQSGGEPVGLLVDRLADVVSATTGDLQAPPANVAGVEARCILGVHQTEEQLVVVLRLEELLVPRNGVFTTPT